MLRTANIKQRADAFLARHRKHVIARALVHHVEAHHEHLPNRIVHRAREHRVGEIDNRILGDADVPDLALGLLLDERRRQGLQRIIVLVRLHAMQIEHVHIVGAHDPQRIVQARDHARGRPPFVIAVNEGLGRHHHLVPRNGFERAADHAFGAVGGRRVDEVDAEPDGLMNELCRFVLGLAGLQAKPRKAAGAEAGNADAEVGFAEGGVLHDQKSTQ